MRSILCIKDPFFKHKFILTKPTSVTNQITGGIQKITTLSYQPSKEKESKRKTSRLFVRGSLTDSRGSLEPTRGQTSVYSSADWNIYEHVCSRNHSDLHTQNLIYDRLSILEYSMYAIVFVILKLVKKIPSYIRSSITPSVAYE